jgi:3-oxoacyl-[acyl-carrier protein] reductase
VVSDVVECAGEYRVCIAGAARGAVPGTRQRALRRAKAAVDYWAAVLAKELGPRNITVNSVMPGLTDTDGMIVPPEQVDAMVAATPLGRIGRPDEVAAVVAFLAGEDAGWVTGQRMAAAGGLV